MRGTKIFAGTRHFITPRSERTHVAVSYQRTALKPEADAWVAHMAELDAKAGDEWAAQINAYLKSA